MGEACFFLQKAVQCDECVVFIVIWGEGSKGGSGRGGRGGGGNEGRRKQRDNSFFFRQREPWPAPARGQQPP